MMGLHSLWVITVYAEQSYWADNAGLSAVNAPDS